MIVPDFIKDRQVGVLSLVNIGQASLARVVVERYVARQIAAKKHEGVSGYPKYILIKYLPMYHPIKI